MAKKTSEHILNTSSNLLGFCLFIITALQLTDKRKLTNIDEFTAVISVFLIVASLLSFLSIRTTNSKLENKFETIADYLFMIALCGIVIVIVFIVLDFIK